MLMEAPFGDTIVGVDWLLTGRTILGVCFFVLASALGCLAAQHLLRPGSLTTAQRQQVLIRYFHTAVDIFEEAGVDFWLDWGTLLGWFRGGRLILHDYDVDFGFYEHDVEAVRRACHRVVKPPLRLEDSSERHIGPKFKIVGLGISE